MIFQLKYVIAAHQAADKVGAMQDAAKIVRRVRKRLRPSQAKLPQWIKFLVAVACKI